MKPKPIEVKFDSYAEYKTSKLVIILEFQNTNTFLLKDTLKIGQKKVFVVSKIKNKVPWTYVISDLMLNQLLGVFIKKNCIKQVKKNSEQKR